MLKPRVIPCLLLRGQGLYKTIKFGTPRYVGDPINAVKIFNEKEVDELLLIDIAATREKREPNYQLIGDIAGECFMPLGYGGGVSSLDQIRRLQRVGVEKVALTSAAFKNARLLEESCDVFGSSSIVAGIDVKRTFFGKYEVWIDAGGTNTKEDPRRYAEKLARLGVGEILVNSIDRDGTMAGFDVPLLRQVSSAVDTPVIACGGAGSLEHIHQAIAETGISAAAAGSLFVYQGRHKAVLINYPTPAELQGLHLTPPADRYA